MHRLSALAIVVIGLVAADYTPALASAVIVPDDFVTIQAAIDSEPDTILIREGTYLETPVVGLSVTIVGIGVGTRPRLSGLDLHSLGDSFSGETLWSVSGCDFSGRVEFRASHYWDVSFSECAMDSGLFGPWQIRSLSIRDCRLRVHSEVRAVGIVMEADTIDGGMAVGPEYGLAVTNCWFRGGAGTALHIEDPRAPLSGPIAHNYIENYDAAIAGSRGWNGVTIEWNTIVGCGIGMDIGGSNDNRITVRNNAIVDCGVGIKSVSDDIAIHDNTILRATGVGMDLTTSYLTDQVVERNVVGECGGTGILAKGDQAKIILRNNTVFNNAGNGIWFHGTSCVAQRNISFGNKGWGLFVSPGTTVELGCNDWFDNKQGSVEGVSLDPTDLYLDPLFCDVEDANVRLMANSPLLDAPNCGLIGALGLGCGATPVLLAFLRAKSMPDAIRIEWQWGGLEHPAQSWIERASDASGPWERIATERRVESGVTVDIDRGVEPSQSYFYRLAWVAEDGRRGASEPIAATALGPIPFALGPIAPNPSSGRVEISWSLPRAGHVDLAVFDIAGREVANVARGHYASGRHVATWHGGFDSGPAPPGLYFARLRFDGHEATKRVLVRQ